MLDQVIEKIRAGERLSGQDGLVLEKTPDLHTVCILANHVRTNMHGKRTGYIVNAHVDYTNICVSRCEFCAYHRTSDDPDAYVLSSEEAVNRVEVNNVDEIHIIGGVNPDLDMDYFLSLLAAFRNAFPKSVIKAFTAVEIHALAKREKLEVETILRQLKLSGLGMIPGGGAEIFDEDIRTKICPGKATADEWLEVHRIAHKLGIPSNTTMLHGHIESSEHRINHLIRLRKLQDETNGVVAHIPLPYLHGNNKLSRAASPPDGTLDIRQIAIARLMLDNIPHIKAYWRALGIRLAQLALVSGADDMDGTIGQEDVMHEAGSAAPRRMTAGRMEHIIEESGLVPFRRNAFHRAHSSGSKERTST